MAIGGSAGRFVAVGFAMVLVVPLAAFAQSLPSLHSTLMLRDGYLVLDPTATRVDLGDHADVYLAPQDKGGCGLSDDAIKAGLIAAIDKTLKRWSSDYVDSTRFATAAWRRTRRARS